MRLLYPVGNTRCRGAVKAFEGALEICVMDIEWRTMLSCARGHWHTAPNDVEALDWLDYKLVAHTSKAI